jgi:hypothetical protein
MADKTTNKSFFQFSAENLSASGLRQQLLQGQGEATLLGAMSEALDVYAFMNTLPDELIESQQRELARLKKRPGEQGPRIEALKVSIARAQQLKATSDWGGARINRAIAAATQSGDVFHGFVSGTGLQMRKGYTVRLMGADGKMRHSAVTQEDGYFTMTLKAGDAEGPFPQKNATEAALLGVALQLFGARGSGASASVKSAMSKEPGTQKELATAEILDPSGAMVQEDPVPFDLNGGTVYREYVVEGKAGEGASKRYLGNSAKFELHDSGKLTRQCNVDAMRESHKVYFDSTAEAEKAGYDYCAYCFGKKMSKR